MNAGARRGESTLRICDLADGMEAALDRLRFVNAHLERTGRTAEVTPGLLRLLGCIEHVETIIDRELAEAIIAAAIADLREAMDAAVEEIGASLSTP
ncbi:hypothetical protein [Methylobacterium sp. sgz302541]|uniref:hypothetical protein n=1 Tax=unclassified Methylobacterium TaxID=2615210 RepID=UPI003D35652B